MIKISTDSDNFIYDIHSLVKAFYPGDDVTVGQDVEDPDFTVFFSGNKFCFKKCDGSFDDSASVPLNADRPDVKNVLKKLIYTSLSTHLNFTLPWGDLTGIRPTKIPMKLINEGKTDEEILKYMKDTYFISDEKGLLSLDIAKREKEILNPLHPDGYSIYIGIPFCPTRCLYCSFTSNPISMFKDRVGDYLACIGKELEFTSRARAGKSVDTIYVGGGTPTTLSAAELDVLLSLIGKYYNISSLLEFTVEAGRPDSITPEKLKVLKEHGVTRISVNPQTMNQKTLDVIGRRHTVGEFLKAYNDAREAGFDNINNDIILGLPGEGEKEVSHTIDEIIKLKPDSLTVHSLAIKRGSLLNERIKSYGLDTMINSPSTMKIAEDGAKTLGLKPYYLYRQKNMAGNFENTGYAREGAYGIYNILIMEEIEPIIAMGAGSVTKIINSFGKPERCDNVKDIDLYIDSIDEMIKRKEELFMHE